MDVLLLVLSVTGQLMQHTSAVNDHHPHPPAPGDTGPCGEYSNQVLANGWCKIVATLPHQDGQWCPDMFRCTDEVSYWIHENDQRKQEVVQLRELISELQEELRNHRHRLRALEHQPGESNHSAALLSRVNNLEIWASESSALQHLQANFIYDIQAQVRNLSLMVESTSRNSSCAIPAALRGRRQDPPPGGDLHQPGNCLTDCSNHYHNGVRSSGTYTILPSSGAAAIDVFCDMDTEGGGWTVIQRRQDGSVSFNKTWKAYKEGFGDLNGEFWLGNENIHRITKRGGYSLWIDLEDWTGQHKYALYREFSIEDEANYYRLHVLGASGTAEDSFAWYHNKRSFSTPESRNLCAEISHGGWWYHQCFYSNLNGVYYPGGNYVKGRKTVGPDGIVWYSWMHSDYYSLKKVSMMIRPRSFRVHQSP
ncbi:angiopoietin-related protein 7-like [Hyperolius riggenbachi]|uniref:angiopoietin-related protein 7-like n=1 Tax=Hyperolius riggenbachi TaxID=752182 RepID=UPI0035A3724D